VQENHSSLMTVKVSSHWHLGGAGAAGGTCSAPRAGCECAASRAAQAASVPRPARRRRRVCRTPCGAGGVCRPGPKVVNETQAFDQH